MKNVPLKESIAAKEALLSAERALSLAKGEETALACEWEVLWEANAPMPHVMTAARKTYLMYAVQEPDLNLDGSSDKLVQISDVSTVALVKLIDCYAYTFGGPNDEVLSGHPLWGRGLSYSSAHVIAHSRWLAEAENINKVHQHYNPDRWKTRKHYLLSFKDETFECLASGYKIEVFRESLEQVAQIVQARLFASEK